MRHRTLFALILFAALALAGCQGLSSALGQSPDADAPVYNGIAVIALPNGWVDVVASPDQSGAVGASGTASQAQTAEQAISVDPAAVAEAIGTVAPLIIPGGRAANMLRKADEALMVGNTELAMKRVKAAEGFAKVEAAEAEEDEAAEPEAE